MSEFLWPVRVYYEDTDAGGIVYYVNYLKFMERARTEWLRSHQFDQSNLPVLFVVKKAEVDYRLPALLDDALEISVALDLCQGARLVFQQQVRREKELLCEARVEVVCVRRDNLRPCRLPAELMQCLPAPLAKS